MTGDIKSIAASLPRDPLTERTRAIWTSGDFGRIAWGYTQGAVAFVDRLKLTRDDVVLDAACGTGNLAIPAARTGANVTGVDIAANLVNAARSASAEAGLPIRFDEGDVEALPYADDSFTTVISMFGVMFAPRPERALDELIRVTRPGGRIALANWTPGGFVGSMLRAHTALVPPPPGQPSVLAWGDAEALRARLEPYRSCIRAVHLKPRKISLAFPLTPGGTVELFRECYGPTVRTYAALEADGRAQLTAELTRLWTANSTAAGARTAVASEYLDVRIDLA